MIDFEKKLHELLADLMQDESNILIVLFIHKELIQWIKKNFLQKEKKI